MPTYNVFLGGNATATTFPTAMMPSVDVLPNQEFLPDFKHGERVFSLDRRLNFLQPNIITDCGRGPSSPALAQYIATLAAKTPAEDLGAGDTLAVNILPRLTSLERVWFNVRKPCPGLVFDLVVRGNSASLGGTTAVPVPVTVATGLSGAAVASKLIVLPTPVYFDQNDMLLMKITAMGPQGIACLDLEIAPFIFAYQSGDN